MEVAVKTIQSDKEEKKVKFLQEAAIMGQFRHPNIVKLMGVVTMGELVRTMYILMHSLSQNEYSSLLLRL